jgi:adrenodoxin-NADP+ reductase
MADSFDTAQAISDDITAGKLDGAKSGSDNLTQYLEDAISWDQWKKLEAHEHSQGDAAGKPREKVNNVAKMLEIARQ